MTRYLVGTSGWMYKDWGKRFYPTDIGNKDKLKYFSEHFKTVEINSTFYHLTTETAVKNWYLSVPDDFVYSVKLSRYITHTIRLKPGQKLNQGLENYFASIHYLKDKLGVILIQLPASFHSEPGRISNLAKQKKRIEKEYKIKLNLAFEFRHKSWFQKDVYKILKEYNLATVIASGPGRWPESREVTADFSYFRFHGDKKLYASSYSKKELDQWAEFIKKDCRNCHTVFCYFNNDHSAKAVDNAKYLASKL